MAIFVKPHCEMEAGDSEETRKILESDGWKLKEEKKKRGRPKVEGTLTVEGTHDDSTADS
jgi:hypothetical protein